MIENFGLDTIQLTPPMSNDDENKRPSTVKTRSNNNNEISSQKEKKSSNTTNQIQYKILQRGQPDESTPVTKKSQLQNELNTSENSSTVKSQRNRRKFKIHEQRIELSILYRTGRSTFK